MMLCNKATVLLLLSVVLLCCRTEGNRDTRRTGRNSNPAPTPRRESMPSVLRKWSLTSNLPIVIVDTSGKWIPDEPKIHAKLTIIYDESGGRNSVKSSHVHFEGKIGIEVRGKTSQMFPKKQYGFEIVGNNGDSVDAPLLNLPTESDWILHAPYSDKTLIRNFLAYHFSNQIGRYAPRAKFVELFMNHTGEAKITQRHYAGVYLLMEKIKRGKDRIDIQSLEPTHHEPLEITGGYILKIDKIDPYDSYFFTDFGTQLIHVYPKGNQINDAQKAWIKNYMNAFETALIKDPKRGYAKYIDTSSFIDYFIINELFRNIDAFHISTYMHRDRGGKLRMGPVWDFNLSMGNANYSDGWKPNGWLLHTRPVPFWWHRLLKDRNFKQQLTKRWNELIKNELALSNIVKMIDQTVEYLAEAHPRNFQRWRILGQYVWPNQYPYPRTYEGEVDRLKTWLRNRVQWMDGHIKSL